MLWFWSIVFVVLGVGSMRFVPGFWRGRYADRLHRTFAPLGDRMGRSFESTVPFVLFGVLYVGLMMVILLLAGHSSHEPATALSTALSVILLGVIAALFLVLLFNRPHVVIPPHLRKGHAGLLGSLFTKSAENSDADDA